jgi:hypothetical protein
MAIRSLDYAHAERRQRRYSHAPITTPVHREGEAWSVLTRLANAWRTAEVGRMTCAACGFIDWSDTGASSAAVAHDNLCCGAPTSTPCYFPADCITHDLVLVAVAL